MRTLMRSLRSATAGLVMVPREGERGARAGEELHSRLGTGRLRIVDGGFERVRRVGKTEELAHLLIPEAPSYVFGARVGVLAAEPIAIRALHVDGRVVSEAVGLRGKALDLDDTL